MNSIIYFNEIQADKEGLPYFIVRDFPYYALYIRNDGCGGGYTGNYDYHHAYETEIDAFRAGQHLTGAADLIDQVR